ncbi:MULTISPECIES: hypothetical protein [unclassified Streptomyces]|uniref:hypothetical protein n=1 Tax=unclassified Streptomyces TaxID=2593676 RepID=UPI001C22DC5A|nr:MULTISPECIES: hypothetical protein [unclassified Streptomyces]
MTRRLLHALATLYALVAVGLTHTAVVSWQHGSWPHAAFFTGAALLLATAVVHHSYQRDELRDAHRRLARATRPDPPQPAIDAVVAVAMAGWCCDTWAATAGTDHDPATCTRKGHTA